LTGLQFYFLVKVVGFVKGKLEGVPVVMQRVCVVCCGFFGGTLGWGIGDCHFSKVKQGREGSKQHREKEMIVM
jgi:hypothetical protein